MMSLYDKDLLNQIVLDSLPKLYSTENTPCEEKKLLACFYIPGCRWRWFVAEGSQKGSGDWLFFGVVDGFEREWGYFTLSELVEAGEGSVGVDESFKWGTPYSEIDTRLTTGVFANGYHIE